MPFTGQAPTQNAHPSHLPWSSRIQPSQRSASWGQAVTHSWSLQARQTRIIGVFGQSPSILMRARLTVFWPKWDQEQMAMQISHSVHSERLNFSISSPCFTRLMFRMNIALAIASFCHNALSEKSHGQNVIMQAVNRYVFLIRGPGFPGIPWGGMDETVIGALPC